MVRSEGERDLNGWRQIVSRPYPSTSATQLADCSEKARDKCEPNRLGSRRRGESKTRRCAARRFAREGYKVAVTERSPDALQVIVDEIMAAGGQAIPSAGDAQQEAGMVDILDRLESIGPVEVGVYNAGNAI